MKTSTKGILALMEFEGVVLVPYRDAAGVWTIGVGHTAAAGQPDPRHHAPITLGHAVDILKADLGKYEHEVKAAVKVPLDQHEFDALVSFHFNTGAISIAALTTRLNAGDRGRAGDGFLNWAAATISGKKVRLAGLLARRGAERAIFDHGDYGEPFMARIYEKWPSKGVLRNLSGLII